MARTPFLEAKNISKSFYGVYALKNVDLTCYGGEVIGVIGENGAGKSTLMKIITGTYSLEDGDIFIEGQRANISNPTVSRALGINMVYQDTRLVPELTVAQNIFLGSEKTGMLGLVDMKYMREESNRLLKKFDIDIDVNALVGDLTMAQMQLVEIVKAMSRQTKLLILDEPTSSLTPREVEKLFSMVRDLKAEGTSVVFISHRIQELLQICDRFVVLKDGELAGGIDAADATEDILVRMMVGRDVKRMFNTAELDYTNREVILDVQHLSRGGDYSDVSFKLYKGEILGFYGIEGNGQREILRSITGILKGYTGDIYLNGKKIAPRTPRQAIDAGISFITNDRHGENVFMPLSIGSNLETPNLKGWSNTGVVNEKLSGRQIQEGIDKFRVKCDNSTQLIRELSGGNQQKVAIAGRFLQKPQLFIFDEPTIGVDVGSKSEIYVFLKQMAEEGIGVIVLSSDLPEIIGLSDRIIPVCSGRVQKPIIGCKATEEMVLNASVLGNKEQSGSENTGVEESTPPVKAKKHSALAKWSSVPILAAIIAIMCVIGGQNNEAFLKPYNIGLILWQLAPLALITLAQVFVVLTGAINLSVGPAMSLITCVLSYTMAVDGNIPMGILSALLVGIACGLINSFIVVKLNIQHFIGTLATQIMFLGIALCLRMTASGSIAPMFTTIVKYKISGKWPVSAFVVIMIFIIAEIVLQRSKFGTYIYAVGSNRDAAYSSGIRTDRIRTLAYVWSGIFGALAGMVLAVRVGCGDPQAGTTFTMQTLTAVVLGGVALVGGKGTVLGPLVGAFLVTVLQNFLNMMQVNAYWQYVYTGALIIIAASIYYYSAKKRKEAMAGMSGAKESPLKKLFAHSK
ncbi:MAG: ATP-binding cassette domain-containing protein [Candidatus Heteroscillospira sp.]|jgi:ribose transport system ATP-binding protein